ncbi:alpha-2 adrenergic receptor-like [Biomphalaria glabrata]|uniref:Alpha-2 adrenergic receptor-like n=1 Tax=Biomphalaria glabrata TaxID=6526 RepID=A0A9W2Z9U4_BIOGL|nr:alpha-2 adrenergic receptor-like [Biomphalaria glabrata]
MDFVTITDAVVGNKSADDSQNYMKNLQYEKTVVTIPTFVLLALLFILGIFGNPLIIFIYYKEKKKTATDILILSISVADLIGTLTLLPAKFYIYLRSYSMKQTFACKMYFFSASFNFTISLCLLLSVAFIRYRKICFTFDWQVEPRHAQVIGVVAIVYTLITSIGHMTVHGRQTTKTNFSGVNTYQCRVDDSFVNTSWPKIFMIILFSMFFTFCVALTYMYVKIGLKARRQMKMKTRLLNLGERKPAPKKNVLMLRSLRNQSLDDHKIWRENKSYITRANKESRDETTLSMEENTHRLHEYPEVKSNEKKQDVLTLGNKKALREFRAEGRTTLMLFTITVIYVVTNGTTILLVVARAMNDQLIVSLGPVSASLYNLFFDSFLINCAINPFIYSLWNKKYRQKCWQIFRRKKTTDIKK